jgi:phosphoribosyl 1,2-cyclic phosphodiesterase
MTVYFASLNSGSNGNCYYIGNGKEGVLVDAGISCRETEKRMRKLGLPMTDIKAIFISHEHTDHIKGVEMLAKKYDLPVYLTDKTWIQCRGMISKTSSRPLLAYQPVQIGDLVITAFPKFHDAGDPHSFIISHQGINIGVFTDIGSPCTHVKKHFSQCHAAFLEANYDVAMLESGPYPIHLKNRISGGKGHLSNHQALELFLQYKPRFMSHLLLSHLSKENNDPVVAQRMFEAAGTNTRIIIASRYEETELYAISPSRESQFIKKAAPVKMVQLDLFG